MLPVVGAPNCHCSSIRRNRYYQCVAPNEINLVRTFKLHTSPLFEQLPGCYSKIIIDSVRLRQSRLQTSIDRVEAKVKLYWLNRFRCRAKQPNAQTGSRQACDGHTLYAQDPKITILIPTGVGTHISTKTPWLDDNDKVQGTIFYGQVFTDTAILEVGHWVCQAT
ncbi:hypothetical protein O9993_08975 [Vibrio lentus]|nr:hypothetical protein [Vibrio lentus]